MAAMLTLFVLVTAHGTAVSRFHLPTAGLTGFGLDMRIRRGLVPGRKRYVELCNNPFASSCLTVITPPVNGVIYCIIRLLH